MITKEKKKVPLIQPVQPNLEALYRRLYSTHQVLLREFQRMTLKYKNEVLKSRKLMKEVSHLKAQLRAVKGE